MSSSLSDEPVVDAVAGVVFFRPNIKQTSCLSTVATTLTESANRSQAMARVDPLPYRMIVTADRQRTGEVMRLN